VDLNGDGKLDLVVANNCADSNCVTGSVSVLLGNGDGTFQNAMTTVVPDAVAAFGQIVVSDFNGDGKLDVAIGSLGVLLRGNGDGTFQTPLFLAAGGPGAAVGDFNGDGRPDLAVGAFTVLLNISPFPSAITCANQATFTNGVAGSFTVTTSGNPTPHITEIGLRGRSIKLPPA